MRFDRIIRKRIRRGEGGVRLDLDVNARIAANIDRNVVQAAPAGGRSGATDVESSPPAAGDQKGGNR